MRLVWLFMPLLFLAGGEAPAQELPNSRAGDQLAALVEFNGPPGLVLSARESRLDLGHKLIKL